MGFFNKKKKRIYLDHAAATPVALSVQKAMSVYWSEKFHNPSAFYQEGVVVEQDLENIRKKVADILSARSSEIIFTQGGTESNNLALHGVVADFIKKNPGTKPHVVISAIEHEAVYEFAQNLAREGKIVLDEIPVDLDGLVNVKAFKELLRENTVLVSVMYANNEIGMVQPLREITKTVRWFKKHHNQEVYPLVHTDAIQAPLYLDLHVARLGVDMMSLSSAKIYGPKGVGVLYVKSGVSLEPIIYGGGQEKGIRSGTENMPLIAGFAQALSEAVTHQEKECERLSILQKYFFEKITTMDVDCEIIINGSLKNRLPNNINISIPHTSSEQLVIELDARGILCSSQSACSVEKEESRVIQALRPSKDARVGSLRFTMGRSTTKFDIDYTIKTLEIVLKKILSTQKRFFIKN
jgi:cysteine desulfurase